MRLLFMFFLVVVGQFSNGQVIVAFSGTSTPSTATVDDMSATALSRGSGINAAGGTTFNSSGWTTSTSVNLTDYIEWTVTADADFSINVTSITINYDRDALFIFGSGPQQLVVRSSTDSYTSNIFSDTSVSISGETSTFSTSQTSGFGGSITYRLYGFNAATGIFGLNFGTFDIEGGLGTILGLANTGISMSGTVSYDGLFYNGTMWLPNAPSGTTGSDNAIVANGTYTITSDVEVDDLEIRTAGTLNVDKANALTVNSDLIVDGDLELDSDSNEYSSLIVDGSVTGDVVYKRHVNNTATLGEDDSNDLIAAPVSGEAFDDFLTNNSNVVSNIANTLYLFGPFNKTTGTYVTYTNTETATLDAANGYRAASTDNGTFIFTGTVNTSTITKSISNSGPAHSEWNLIGNPYPSYIKLSDFLSSNNLQFDPHSAGIYGYDGDASNGWTIWNMAYSDDNPTAVITPGQGFLVASKSGGGTITFNSTMRTKGTSDDFIAGRNTPSLTSSHLKLLLSKDSKSYATDFYFNPNASLGFDHGYDSSVFGGEGANFSLFSHLIEDNDGRAIAIQSLGLNDYNNTIIPLGVKANQGEQLTFEISESTLPENIDVYLNDSVANTSLLLNSNEYILTPTTDLVGTGRFFLEFRNTTLVTSAPSFKDLNVYVNRSIRSLVISGQLTNITVAKLYDMQGREIISQTLSIKTSIQSIDLNSFQSGVYVVHLADNVQNWTKKVIVD